MKYGDQYNVARCALLLARLYLFESAEDRTNVHFEIRQAEHLLLLARDIFTAFHETLYLKLTYLYLVSVQHATREREGFSFSSSRSLPIMIPIKLKNVNK